MRYEIVYKVGDQKFTNDSKYLKVKIEGEFSLSIDTIKEVELISAKIFYSYNKEGLLFCNGFQTWTDAGLYKYGQKTPHLKPLAKLTDPIFGFKTVGDYTWCEQDALVSHTFTYIQTDNNVEFYGALNERTGFTSFHFKDKLEIHKDVQKMVVNGKLRLFDIFHYNGTIDTCFDCYFKRLGISKPTAPILDGYSSWYKHYTNITEEKLLSDLDGFNKVGSYHPKLFQLDDGYESRVGDWLEIDKVKFPYGLEKSVFEIKKAKMIPGIWLAPFVCEKKSKLRQTHPEWITAKGASNWSGIFHLDPSNPGVKAYLHQVFSYYKSLGFRFFKLDFLYAAGYLPLHGKSRGQLMYEAMDFLREELEGCYILGCGVPLGSAFGKVDYCRISTDVTENDDGPWYFHYLHRERLSTTMALKDIVARAPLNGRAFNNDPDVFFLRDCQLNPKLKNDLFEADLKYGNLLLTSDDISLYSKEDIEKLMRIQAKVEGHK